MRRLETLHVLTYFAPETAQAYAALGHKGMQGYFASRSAPMGAVDGQVTLATFYGFAPTPTLRSVPSCWQKADPATTLDARHAGTLAALRRCVGQVDAGELDEAVELVRVACQPLTTAGRALYAGHAGLPWPDEPLLALWHGATLLREHRGDGHVMSLVHHGLDPVEAIVSYGAATSGNRFLRATRGWTDEEWAAGEQRLRARGLLAEDSTLTVDGTAVRTAVEADTDRLGAVGWQHLGDERAGRLGDLVRPWARAVVDSGALGPVSGN